MQEIHMQEIQKILVDIVAAHFGISISTLNNSPMKYVLNKDLPTFKAGTLATFNNGIFKSEDGKVIAHFSATDLATHPNILTEWFTPVEEKRKAVPDDNEYFYYVCSDGDILVDKMPVVNLARDIIDQGNWRWTQEEAELEVKKRAAIERVRRYIVSNDLLEEDKNEIYYFIFSYRNKIHSETAVIKKHYSPYGHIKNTDLTQFLKDCQEDLLIIHS